MVRRSRPASICSECICNVMLLRHNSLGWPLPKLVTERRIVIWIDWNCKGWSRLDQQFDSRESALTAKAGFSKRGYLSDNSNLEKQTNKTASNRLYYLTQVIIISLQTKTRISTIVLKYILVIFQLFVYLFHNEYYNISSDESYKQCS